VEYSILKSTHHGNGFSGQGEEEDETVILIIKKSGFCHNTQILNLRRENKHLNIGLKK
jgi:hypothetical protein